MPGLFFFAGYWRSIPVRRIVAALRNISAATSVNVQSLSSFTMEPIE